MLGPGGLRRDARPGRAGRRPLPARPHPGGAGPATRARHAHRTAQHIHTQAHARTRARTKARDVARAHRCGSCRGSGTGSRPRPRSCTATPSPAAAPPSPHRPPPAPRRRRGGRRRGTWTCCRRRPRPGRPGPSSPTPPAAPTGPAWARRWRRRRRRRPGRRGHGLRPSESRPCRCVRPPAAVGGEFGGALVRARSVSALGGARWTWLQARRAASGSQAVLAACGGGKDSPSAAPAPASTAGLFWPRSGVWPAVTERRVDAVTYGRRDGAACGRP